MGERMKAERLARIEAVATVTEPDAFSVELLEGLIAERVKVDELEAENGRLLDALEDDGVLVVEVENKRDSALVEGLRELAEKWRDEEAEANVQNGGSVRDAFECADELEQALLGEESEDE